MLSLDIVEEEEGCFARYRFNVAMVLLLIVVGSMPRRTAPVFTTKRESLPAPHVEATVAHLCKELMNAQCRNRKPARHQGNTEHLPLVPLSSARSKQRISRGSTREDRSGEAVSRAERRTNAFLNERSRWIHGLGYILQVE